MIKLLPPNPLPPGERGNNVSTQQGYGAFLHCLSKTGRIDHVSKTRVHLYISGRVQGVFFRARTREECIRKMERALDEFIIEGPKTTVPFHQKLMKDENFRKGNFNTSFLNDFNFKD